MGHMKKTTKIGIIGAGHVGSHVASSLMTQGLCDEIVLLDTDEGKARRGYRGAQRVQHHF